MTVHASLGVAITLSSALGLFAMQQGAAVEIDHVILGINDLDRGMREFESRTGVTPKRGGEHPGRGTQNALVALGGGRYLEILAPAATGRPDAPREQAVTHPDLTVVGWALHTPGISATVQQVRRVGIEIQGPTPGSRRAPDGTLLEWQSAAVDDLGVTPFLIEWSRDTVHPGTTSPSGCSFVSMELVHPAPERLELLFKTVGFSATVSKAPRPGMKVTLDCPRGRVEFRS